MPLPGADCDAPIRGDALTAAGKGWVGRYVADHPGGVDLSAAEVADHHAHGVADLLLREFSTDDLGSPASAVGGAQQAIAKARALNVPANGTVALVLCEDNVNPNGPAVAGAMAQATSLLRGAGFLAGFYGRKDIARALVAGGHVDVTFVVDTWGNDQPTDHWNFRQLPNAGQPSIGGVSCDVDDAPNPLGLWAPAPVVTPEFSPALVLEPVVAFLAGPGGAWLLAASGAVFAFGVNYYGGTNGKPYFAGRTAARLLAPTSAQHAAGYVYVVEDTVGEQYGLPDGGVH